MRWLIYFFAVIGLWVAAAFVLLGALARWWPFQADEADDAVFDTAVLREGRTPEPHELPSRRRGRHS